MLDIQKFQIEGLLLITPKPIHDERGFFVERYNQKRFSDAGLPKDFSQDNFSRSFPKVLRGLHYQYQPTQLKLVTCLQGQILDVALDLRKGSPTFGRHETVSLSGNSLQWLLIPAGFAHGFSVISNTPADVLYKVDNPYSASAEGAIHWSDPELNINWQIENPIVSSKDQQSRSWNEFKIINPF
jgi:dTDP-4-dehydrorhamnose 3,5-epimerase